MKKKIITLSIILALFQQVSAYFYESKEMASILKSGAFYDKSGNRLYAPFLPGYEYAGAAMNYGWQNGANRQSSGLSLVGNGLLTMVTPSEYIGPSFLYGLMGFGMGLGYGLAAPVFVGEYGYRDLSYEMEYTMQQAQSSWQRNSFGSILAYPAAYLKNSARILVRTTGVAVVSAVGMAAGVGIVAPLSCALPAGAILLNPVYGAGKICYGLGEISYGLTVDQLAYGTIWPTAITAYNSAAGLPFVLLTKQATVQRISGKTMRMSLESPDYAAKLVFEDSISLPRLSTEEQNKLFSTIINQVTCSSNAKTKQKQSPLDSLIAYQQTVIDSLNKIALEEPVIKYKFTTRQQDNQTLTSIAHQYYLSDDLQKSYARYRIEKACAKDSSYNQLQASEQRECADSVTIRLQNTLVKNFSRGSQSADFWSIDIWQELISWFW